MSTSKFLRLYRLKNTTRYKFNVFQMFKNFSSVAEKAQPNETVKIKSIYPQTPFLKNTFAGIFDKNVLIFPESLSKKEIKELEDQLIRIKEFSEQNAEDVINKETLNKMKELGLLSLQAADTQWTATALLRLFEDLHPSHCHFLYNHNLLAARCIETYGTDEAKETVKTHLSSNNSTIALAIHEQFMGDDLSQINTEAKVSNDGLTYVINGRKSCVVMPPQLTDFLIVFAKVKSPMGAQFTNIGVDKPTSDPVTALLVDMTTNKNIQLQGPLKSFGGHVGLDVYNVELVDVHVPFTHVLGHVGGGFKMAVELLYGSLFLRAANHASLLKQAIGHVSKYCLEHKQFGKSLTELPMIQEKLGRMNVHAYVMESMAYTTAGMVDRGREEAGRGHGGMGRGDGGEGDAMEGYMDAATKRADVFVESACTQVFCSEHLRRSLHDGLSVYGRDACYGENPVSKLLTSLPHDPLVSNDMLRRYIALNCLQHAGVVIQNSLRKYRNPLNHLGYLVKVGWRKALSSKDEPPLLHRLHLSVHPDLSICAESLETRVMLMHDLVIKYWTIFFNVRAEGGRVEKLEEEEIALKRFADLAIHTYAITCCLARATRAKSIGLMNADYEIMTCQAVVATLMERIDEDIKKLDIGDHSNGDVYALKLAREALKKKSHPLQHPLSRTW